MGLAAAFLFISAMVYFSNGKSKKWVARKMWIGGLLLSLSYISCSNNQVDRNKQIKYERICYMMVLGNGKIEIEIDTNNIIYGSIGAEKSEKFSYAIVDAKGITKQKNDIFMNTYMSDPYSQEFIVEVNQHIDTGKYQFRLYSCALKDQDSMHIVHKYDFKIIK